MKIGIVLVLLLVAFALGAWLQPVMFSTTVDDDTVVLEVKGHQNPKLEVVSNPSSKCVKNPTKKGCIEVGVGQDATIKFVFRNKGQRKNWHFTQFEICPWDEDGQDGKRPDADSTNCTTLLDAEADDFQVRSWDESLIIPVTAPTGLVDLLPLAGGGDVDDLDEFKVKDFNNVEQDYFYRIQVCNDGDAQTCLWLDPPVTNKGRGRGTLLISAG